MAWQLLWINVILWNIVFQPTWSVCAVRNRVTITTASTTVIVAATATVFIDGNEFNL